MDTSAVITQVTPDNNNDETLVLPEDSLSEATTASSSASKVPRSATEKKKKRASNFFRSLSCCLGLRSSSSEAFPEGHPLQPSGNTRDSSNSPASPPPPPSSSSSRFGSNKHQQQQQIQQLLPPLNPRELHKKCIVIDLDETLVHSSFKPINNADFIVPVEIEGTIHQVYVLKRPYVDEFLCKMGELYECVLFTASLAKYADPVADLLDKWNVFRSRLFRESCVFHRGNYVKDLSRLGREMHKILIVDNSPASYIFHPDNAIPVVSWFDDMNDRELLDLIPFLDNISKVESVYSVLQANKPGSIITEQNSSIKKKDSNFLM